ncbi:MAG TPA: hypothetical protein VKD72_06095 [Gemmataceae bacterium]|nr:hypothetical protein [Gemmataceae bacterium]
MRHLILALLGLSLLTGNSLAAQNPAKRETREPSRVSTYEATFSPDSKQIVLAGLVWWSSDAPVQRDMAYFVRLVDLASGKELWKIVSREEHHHPYFVPDRPWVLVTAAGGFELRDRQTGAVVKSVAKAFRSYPPSHFKPAPDGNHIVGWGLPEREGTSGGYSPADLRIRVWDLPKLRQRTEHDSTFFGPHLPHDIVFAPRGRLALLLSQAVVRAQNDDANLKRLWNTRTGEVLATFGPYKEPYRELWNAEVAAWSPDGRFLLLDRADRDGDRRRDFLVLWDVRKKKVVRRFEDRKPNKNSSEWPTASFLSFSADGKHAVSCDADHMIRRWDVGSGELLGAFNIDQQCAIGLSPDSRLAIVDSANHGITLRDTKTGKAVQTLQETPWEHPPQLPLRHGEP